MTPLTASVAGAYRAPWPRAGTRRTHIFFIPGKLTESTGPAVGDLVFDDGGTELGLHEFHGGSFHKLLIAGVSAVITANWTFNDNVLLRFGTGVDSTISYDGTDMIINPDAVGVGNLKIQADVELVDNDKLILGTSDSAQIFYDGTDLIINPDAVGTGDVKIQGDLGHTGTNLGFYSKAPVARPSAYTQTFATADKTHAAATGLVLTDNSGGTASQTLAAIVGGGAGCEDTTKNAIASLADEMNKVIADLADVKQLSNAIIDDLQDLGLLP